MFTQNNSNGFTIIELIIALCISSFVMAAIYMTFQSQHRSFIVQDQVSAMQQNLRSALYIMQQDIWMAGYDPTSAAITNTNAAIYNAGTNSISFRMDITGGAGIPDGVTTPGTDEEITCAICDGDGDGDIDDLCRNGALLAQNIEAVGFAYAYDADDDGIIDTYTDAGAQNRIIWAADTDANGDWDNLDSDNDGLIDNADSPTPGNLTATETIWGTDTGTTVDGNQIKAVKIWILAKTDRGDKFFDNNTYIVGDQKIPGRDQFRRRLLSLTVKCKNIGL